MLDKSRAADSGLKLKVNEQILDSCTELMKYIRKLVQRSRLLQKEIVEQGKVWQIYFNIYLYICCRVDIIR